VWSFLSQLKYRRGRVSSAVAGAGHGVDGEVVLEPVAFDVGRKGGKATDDLDGSGPPVDWMKRMCKGELLLGRSLETAMTLGPPAQWAFVGLFLAWRYVGYGRVRVISSRRSLDDQHRLYGHGRTRKECAKRGVPVEYSRPELGQVTWCKPEDSMHLQGRAMDLMLDEYDAKHQRLMYAIARCMGFKLGVDWKKVDSRHFEWRGK